MSASELASACTTCGWPTSSSNRRGRHLRARTVYVTLFSASKKIGGPRQPDPGTQPGCYRCSLPGLTGFTAGCRGGTDADLRYFTSLFLVVRFMCRSGRSPSSQGLEPFERAVNSELPCAPTALVGRASDNPGEVAERLQAHAWKVCIRPKGVSRVRIPPSPPLTYFRHAKPFMLRVFHQKSH